MKNIIWNKWILAACLAGSCVSAGAQKMVKVSGVVYNISGNKKTPFSDIAVDVYAIKTVAEAKDLSKILNSNDPEKMMMLERESVTRTDENGYYEIIVPNNGALIFKAGLNEVVMEKVDHRMKIDVSIDDGQRLEGITVTATRTELKPEPKAPRLVGNQFMPYNTFDIPERMGNNYSRLIIQPYILDCTTNDTIAFAKPLVYDGKEYKLTQERRMGFNREMDPLSPFVVKDQHLSTDAMSIEWCDTIVVPYADHNYSCFANVGLEDYSGGYIKTFQISTCEAKRPMKFLDYFLAFESMKLEDYPERPQIEKRNTQDRISLNFEINSETLTDSEDNKKKLANLRSKLKSIADSPGAVIKEFHVIGTASPDGNYGRNKMLAEQRMKRIEKEITSILPPYTLERVYRNPQANVASWEEVVKLMERDGKTEQAAQTKEILNKHKDMMRQGKALKALPNYKSDIIPYLDELRTVNYQCVYEIYREPNEEEIMGLYAKNGVNGVYTRYEYWRLFDLIKDEKELEKIYKKAYEASIATDAKRPWVLPANNLAVLYLKQGKIDTELLKPLIDRTVYITNYRRSNVDNSRMEIINPVEVVSNQLCMLIRKGDFEDASILAKMLPEEDKYELLKAYVWALGGYYQGGSTPEEVKRAKRTFETIRKSSPRNEVVMYLALENQEGDNQAEQLLANFPENEAMTWYFKAIISARKGDSEFTNTSIYLAECFKRDKSLVPVAQNDGEFNEEIIEVALSMSDF